MISARGVRHFRHCMFFTALENPFYTSLLVDFFVLGTYFSRRTIDNDVSDRKEIAQSTFTIISRRLKGCNFVVCAVCAIQWVTLSNGEVASERRPGLGHTDDFHVILCINCIRNTFPNCPISIDCHLDDHTAQTSGMAEHP